MTRIHETIFEAVDVLRMFPTFVWKAELKAEVNQRINQRVITMLDRTRQTMGELAPGQSWQSDQDLPKFDEFRELVSCANDAVGCVLEFLKIAEDVFEITGFRANMNAHGSAHGMHSHPNNFLSGVYYVQTDMGADTINFHDPRSQTHC